MLKPIFVCLVLVLLVSCSTIQKETHHTPIYSQSIEQRISQLNALNKWKISGKIAFIQSKKRESASIHWHIDESSQQLDLTSYLGINVLHLSSKNESHHLKVDGKSYQTNDLDNLIESLTGFPLPTKALSSWIKGLAFDTKDTITYSEENKLPKVLTSYYQNRIWQIEYRKYSNIEGYQLPTSLQIKHDDLTIKIAINQWTIN